MKFTSILFVASLILLHSSAQAASHRKMVFVNQYDLDGDWQLFKDEFDHARQRRFKNMDENQDQLVNEDEYVFEYQNKLDMQFSLDRKGQIQQTIVRFSALDKNENGRMEWEEYAASGKRSFARYDVNKDDKIDAQDPLPASRAAQTDEAKLSKTEQEKRRLRQLTFAKRALKMPTTHDQEGMFTKYDQNQDKSITLAEHTQRRRADFDLTDEDANGWVSESEYLFEYKNRVDAQIAKSRKAAIKQTYVRFDVLDKNSNGQMTLEEYQVSGHRSFGRWDINQDNLVSMEEALPTQRQSTNSNNLQVASNGE